MCALFPEINLPWYINVTDRRQKGGERQRVGARENRGRGYRSWKRKGQEVGVLKGWEEGKIGEIMQLLSLMMPKKGCGV